MWTTQTHVSLHDTGGSAARQTTVNSHHPVCSACVWVETHLLHVGVVGHGIKWRGASRPAGRPLHYRHAGTPRRPGLPGNVWHVWNTLARHHHWNHWHAIRTDHLARELVRPAVVVHVIIPPLVVRGFPLTSALVAAPVVIAPVIVAIATNVPALSAQNLIVLVVSSTTTLRELVRLRTLPAIRLLHAVLPMLLPAVHALLVVPALLTPTLTLLLWARGATLCVLLFWHILLRCHRTH